MNYCFQDKKKKAFTLSFDDGVLQDQKLIKILDKYNVKCTFNINFGTLGNISKTTNKDLPVVDYSIVRKQDLKEVYKNHEVGGHSLNHSHLVNLPNNEIEDEIIKDKDGLQNLLNKEVKIFAYPYGEYNKNVIDILNKANYIGARTVDSTYNFSIPNDFLKLNPTCHYNDVRLMELAKKFVEEDKDELSLFYVWGHCYEFDQYNNHETIDKLLSYLSIYKDDIWFATNGEIISYINEREQ